MPVERPASVLLSLSILTMILNRSGRVIKILVILSTVILWFSSFSQCKISHNQSQTFTVQGITPGIDHYYRNLIIQDLAIADQKKFQDILLSFKISLNFTVDNCNPAQSDVSCLPVNLLTDPVSYRGFDISGAIRPQSADLIFHVRENNSMVIDSLIFFQLPVNDTSGLYHLKSFRPGPGAEITVDYSRAVFQFTKSSYENFRDRMLEIDNYYAAAMLADSTEGWISTGFLSASGNMPELQMKQVELARILTYIDPRRFMNINVNGQNDPAKLNEKYQALLVGSARYKAIISFSDRNNIKPGYSFTVRQIIETYLDRFDYYNRLSYLVDFRFANFLAGLSNPVYTNAILLDYDRYLKQYTGLPGNASAIGAKLLVNGLINRGREFEAAGNQLRARTYYYSAEQAAQLLRLSQLWEVASQSARKMNEAIAASYIGISRKGALKANPSLAAQYFYDAEALFSYGEEHSVYPSWLNEYENWLFKYFEEQAVLNLGKNNFNKTLEYLNEIRLHCLAQASYPCPEHFHDWMRAARDGVYLDLLTQADRLMKADETAESEQVFNQAVNMRRENGYRIEKDVIEAQLEVQFRQVYHDEYVDEGLQYFIKQEYVSALYYLNKAAHMESSGVKVRSPGLQEKRQAAASQVIDGMLSEGRLKAWANDFEGAEKVLSQVERMLSEYQFAESDTLNLMYAVLQENLKRSECIAVRETYDELMAKSTLAEKSGDYIMAHQYSIEAVSVSMDNLSCRLNDEQAWFKKINLETMADFQEMEEKLDRLAEQSVTEYLSAYQDLKRYYNRHKLLKQGVVFIPLIDRVVRQKNSAFLAGMTDHFLYLKDYDHALLLLQRMHDLEIDPELVSRQQESLGEALARRDVLKIANEKPWVTLESYTGSNRWYHDFSRSYKKSCLKANRWKLKFWPVIWKK